MEMSWKSNLCADGPNIMINTSYVLNCRLQETTRLYLANARSSGIPVFSPLHLLASVFRCSLSMGLQFSIIYLFQVGVPATD